MSISRLFEMLYILLENERVSATSLAERLEVSVRTVYRDVQALSEAGVPIYAERGRSGGLCILPTFKLCKAMLSEEERTSILASLRAMAQSGAGEDAALRKLTAFFGDCAPDWVQIDLSDWSGQHEALLATLKAAILEKHALQFDYYSESGEKRNRRVCPLKLWFKGHAWYLLAFCLERQAVRTFKLTRIKRATIVLGAFPDHIPAFAQPTAVPSPDTLTVDFTLRINRCMAFRVFDDFDESQIEIHDDGFLVHASFPPGGWVLSFILGYGAHAQVVEPQSLRKEVCDALQNMLDLYKT